MEVSPLVQDARPSFQPKIAKLYSQLFNFEDEDDAINEGFWSEFFLLKPDRQSFQKRLEEIGADDLLHFQHETQPLFSHAVSSLKAGRAPGDEFALDTLTVFLAGVLSKKYTNPSSDIITVLAGLNQVDTVFSDFANAIESTIRTGRTLDVREKAIQVVLSMTSGAYQTSLVSYFTHRDLFPALMKYVQDSDTSQRAFEPFLLLGLLANYNKFEYRNPYRLRLEDFVNEAAVSKIIYGFTDVCTQLRSKYIEIIDDVPDSSWSLANALAYIGLGVLAPIKAINPIAAAPEDDKEKFAILPGPEASVFLAVYDFVYANKVFSFNLLFLPPESKTSQAPLSAYLSLISYTLHHAYRSPRASLYGILSLSTLRIIIEDPSLCKRICDPSLTTHVRLCRQRQPFLPVTPTLRPNAAHILDIAVDAINHNLRRRLDVDLYAASLNLIHRLLVCLAQNRIHFPYHWALLWQSLLSLTRFLHSYAQDLLTLRGADVMQAVTSPLLKSLALAVAHGTNFLPDPAAYDDLSYKLVERHETLVKLKQVFPNLSGQTLQAVAPIDVLITTAAHFHEVLEAEKEKGKVRSTLSTKEVGKAIRAGYESLEIADVGGMGVEVFDVWREGEERALVKKAGRTAVEDARRLVAGEGEGEANAAR